MFGPCFKFHSNLSFNKSNLKEMLPFYRQMVISWSQYLSSSHEAPSQVLSQFLWCNNYIKIEDDVIHFEKLSNKNINFLPKLFENGRIIWWINLKDKYELMNDMFFQWAQLKHAIPTRWKTLISNYSDIDEENLCQNYHLIKGSRILPTDKLSSKKIYLILISNILSKPTSNIYFEKLFENTVLDWSKTYLLPRLAAIDTTLGSSNTQFSRTYSFSIKIYTISE